MSLFYLLISVVRNSDSLVIQIFGTIVVIPCIKITYLGGKFSKKIRDISHAVNIEGPPGMWYLTMASELDSDMSTQIRFVDGK